MITKAKEWVDLPDQEYIGIWNDDHVCVPFSGYHNDVTFTVDFTAPYSDINVFVNIQDGWAICETVARI